MSVWGAIAGGFVGTLLLTTGLVAASELRLTRIDLPFLLGTMLVADRTRAKALGYLLHFLAGQVFALIYYAVFEAIDESGWLLGADLRTPTRSLRRHRAGQHSAARRAPSHGNLRHRRRFEPAARAAGLSDAELRSLDTAGDARGPRGLRRDRRRVRVACRLTALVSRALGLLERNRDSR